MNGKMNRIMKRLSLVVTALLVSVTMSFAGNKPSDQVPVVIDMTQLSRYLQLDAQQVREVVEINDYFIEMQRKSLTYSNKDLREKKMEQAIYGNLKLMKETLTEDQYRSYLGLLNLTHNNRSKMLRMDSLQDTYWVNQTN